MASSSSWRSSDRMSRSPVRGSRPVSSRRRHRSGERRCHPAQPGTPPDAARIASAPWCTVRCRFGSLRAVGRPASWRPAWPARPSGAAECCHASPPGQDVVESRSSWLRCQGVLVADPGEQPDTVGQCREPFPQRTSAAAPAPPVAAGRRTESRPASSTLLLPTSSRGRVVSSQLRGIIGQRHPGQDAIEAEPPGVVDVHAVGPAVLLVEPHRMFASRTQSVMVPGRHR